MSQRAAQSPSGTPELGALPEWDLADLYPGTASPELKRDLESAAKDAKAFAARYRGKLEALNSADFGAAIAAYEAMPSWFMPATWPIPRSAASTRRSRRR